MHWRDDTTFPSRGQFIRNAISRDKSVHEPIVCRPAHPRRLVGVLVIGRVAAKPQAQLASAPEGSVILSLSLGGVGKLISAPRPKVTPAERQVQLAHPPVQMPRGETAGPLARKNCAAFVIRRRSILARTFSHFEQTGLRANDHTVETSSIGKRPVSRSASVGSQFGKTSRICFAVIRLRYDCCFRNFLIISESICRSASQS
jgi:hypothetical protein